MSVYVVSPSLSVSMYMRWQQHVLLYLICWQLNFDASILINRIAFAFWEGFDVQMKGPDLVPEIRNSTQTRATSNEYRTVQQKPGSARSADVFLLDPDLTYRFRVVPKARLTDGEPSEVHRIGPGMANLQTDSIFLPQREGRYNACEIIGYRLCRWCCRWRSEWSCHNWHCSWNPLQPPLPAPAGWPHLPVHLLQQEQK